MPLWRDHQVWMLAPPDFLSVSSEPHRSNGSEIPLFGQLRRMAGLVDAEFILLPVSVTWETNPAPIEASPRVRFTVALIAARTGHVVWYGVEEGDDHPRDDPRALATAAERLSESLLWYVRPGPRG